MLAARRRTPREGLSSAADHGGEGLRLLQLGRGFPGAPTHPEEQIALSIAPEGPSGRPGSAEEAFQAPPAARRRAPRLGLHLPVEADDLLAELAEPRPALLRPAARERDERLAELPVHPLHEPPRVHAGHPELARGEDGTGQPVTTGGTCEEYVERSGHEAPGIHAQAGSPGSGGRGPGAEEPHGVADG